MVDLLINFFISLSSGILSKFIKVRDRRNIKQESPIKEGDEIKSKLIIKNKGHNFPYYVSAGEGGTFNYIHHADNVSVYMSPDNNKAKIVPNEKAGKDIRVSTSSTAAIAISSSGSAFQTNWLLEDKRIWSKEDDIDEKNK